jgi:hypothetical protein
LAGIAGNMDLAAMLLKNFSTYWQAKPCSSTSFVRDKDGEDVFEFVLWDTDTIVFNDDLSIVLCSIDLAAHRHLA